MTKRTRKAKAPAEGAKTPKPMIFAEEGQSREEALAGAIVAPGIRHGHLGQELAKIYVKQGGDGSPDLADFVSELDKVIKAGAKGDLTFASRALAAQAMTLDAIFTEMARRMAANMGEYLGATETYARIAMKAQAGSRQAIETLAKLHQPREQTVRHVHVNEGGQAVIADEFHHHAGGHENGRTDEQPHATGTDDSGASPALPCPDPLGEAVPIPSREGQRAMQDARRQGQRGT